MVSGRKTSLIEQECILGGRSDSCTAMIQTWSRNDVVADQTHVFGVCRRDTIIVSRPRLRQGSEPLVVKLIGDNGRPGLMR